MVDSKLTNKTYKSVKWSYLSTIVNSIFQIVYTAIMSRLLDPSSFGIFALAGLFLRFGSYFSRMGLGQAVIRKLNITQDEIKASFTVSFFVGIFFTIVCYLAAPLSKYIFETENVIAIIKVMSLTFFLTGLSSISESLLRKELRFKELAIAEIISFILGFGLFGISSAYLGFGVWSLVIANLSQLILYSIIIYIRIKHPLTFCFKIKDNKELFSFGGKISVIGFLEFIGFNVDTLMIGRYLGSNILGIYNRSFAIVNLPVQYITVTFSKVFYPAFSKVQNDEKRVKKAFINGSTIIFSVVFPICLGVIPAAKELISTLLGEKWLMGVSILQIMALILPFNMGTILPASIMQAKNKLNEQLILQILFVVIIILGIMILFKFGIIIVALTVTIANIIRYIAYMSLMLKYKILNTFEIINTILPGIFIGIVVSLFIYGISFIFRDLNNFLLLSFEIITGTIILYLSFFVIPLPSLKKVIYEIKGNINISPFLTNILFRFYN